MDGIVINEELRCAWLIVNISAFYWTRVVYLFSDPRCVVYSEAKLRESKHNTLLS